MFTPKPYQQEALEKLAAFLDAARYENLTTAFADAAADVPAPWGKPYRPLNGLAGTPYVCLRLPTGGGKTFLASTCLKIGARYLEREPNPLVLWLVPTDTIRRQTLETLLNPGHSNRKALEADFNGRLRVVDITDFALLTPQDLRDKACIVVGTFAALRVEKTVGRKVYSHNEDLEPHFSRVPPKAAGLERCTVGNDQGSIKFSFANIMALIQPLVIIDEAHNAKTPLSIEVLQRVNAGCVIEFSATPAPDSNILHHVSASQLKAQHMIKLPIILTEQPSWQEALMDAILTRKKLETLAGGEPEFVRPIVLIQAENKDREVSVEVVHHFLMEQGGVDEHRIAIATGSQKELDDVNLLEPDCKIEFVITVQALKEGWDCPFAYVFCSVAAVHSAKDVEQLLGRVLRMPYAKKQVQDDLNRAYAFVSRSSWPLAVSQLHDRLVSMGFDEVEAARYVVPDPRQMSLPGIENGSAPYLTLSQIPDLEAMPVEARGLIHLVPQADGTVRLALTATLDPETETALLAALPDADREKGRRFLETHRQQKTISAPKIRAKPLLVPQLCLWVDGELEVAQEEHFLAPGTWHLLDYPAELSPAEFSIDQKADTFLIDVQGKRLVHRHLGTQMVFDFDDVPMNWTDLQLARKLDAPLRQKDIRQEVLIEFIRRAINCLIKHRGLSLNTLYRARAALERALRNKIETYRQAAKAKGYQASLFGPQAAVETSFRYAFAFDPENYPVTAFYTPGFQFQKHFYHKMVAAFDNDEEMECAKAIDINPKVKRWVRNIKGMFSLPTSRYQFYPDFVAELVDGRILVVEYKGGHLIEHDQDKKNIGELWAEKSGGKALFLWAVKKDAAGRPVDRQLADAISV